MSADAPSPALAENVAAAPEWHYLSAHRLVEALRARRLSVRELVDRTIERIESLDGRVNSIVERDFERARAAATLADAALARGERAPLLGVPITVKEAFDVEGLNTSWGMPQFRGHVASSDIEVVTRLKRAGAIVIGKTNVPLGLGDFQSYNDIHGQTNNPWDLGRTPGGSSGGCAAAVAAGFVPLSFGSDIGGSVRVPAHFCGIFSHKPTFGLVPLQGYGPPPLPAPPRAGDLAVIGPMARTAADLRLTLDVIAGADDAGTREYFPPLAPPRHDRLADYSILVIDTHPLIPTSADVRAALDGLADRLASTGAAVARTSPQVPDLAASSRLYMRLLGAARGARAPAQQYDSATRAAAALQASDDSLAASYLRGLVASHRQWITDDGERAWLREQWQSLFRGFDVVLYPAFAVPAFAHDHTLPIEDRRLLIDSRPWPYNDACYVWADPATTCGLPSTVAPIDKSSDGLPIGVQIIGPHLGDRITIAFAGLLEREFGGFTPPPGFSG
jgi:amidase